MNDRELLLRPELTVIHESSLLLALVRRVQRDIGPLEASRRDDQISLSFQRVEQTEEEKGNVCRSNSQKRSQKRRANRSIDLIVILDTISQHGIEHERRDIASMLLHDCVSMVERLSRDLNRLTPNDRR